MRTTPHHHHHQLLLPPPSPKLLLPSNTNTTASGSSHQASIGTIIDTLSVSSLATIATSPAYPDSAATAFWDYQRLFASQRAETSEPVLLRLIEGSIPADFPQGMYYLAGPGLFSDDHGSTVHPLDGHGYLRAFDFREGGAVWYSARYVATQAQQEERDEETGQWHFTHRGPFSVLRRGKRVGNMKVMKNVANTNVLKWGTTLMCMWEGGEPHGIDPQSLDTTGPVDLVGVEDRHLRRGRTARERNGGGVVADLIVDVAAHFLKPVLRGKCKCTQRQCLVRWVSPSHV